MANQPLSGNQLLRVQIFDYLQDQMRKGILEPGASISVNKLIEELGVSRTPLREALLLLQEQGFVTILPQRGVTINRFTLEDTREIYEILGGIESRVVLSVFPRIGPDEIQEMKRLNGEMETAIALEQIDRHNRSNVAFHNCFLNLSDNQRLLRYVNTLKMQLYEFPKRNYGRLWNETNLKEHVEFIRLIEAGNPGPAAEYLRDIHWEFKLPDTLWEA